MRIWLIRLTDIVKQINNNMKIHDIITEQTTEIDEWQATRSLCKSSKPDSAIGASALASCKSQGYRSRSGNKSHKISKNKRVKVGGKKLKGAKYGGVLPDYGSGS